jgi:Flp pilus assembly pilin Flp
MDKKRGVGMIEYAMLIAVVVAAVTAIGVYYQRALHGRWRQAADTFGFGRQYNSADLKIWGP